MRGFALIVVALLVAGCGAEGAQFADAAASPSAPAEVVEASEAPSAPALDTSPTAGGRSPAANRTTAGAPPAGSVARPCRMADLRFWLSVAMPNKSPTGSGSVQMTNTAADRCRVSGYITVRWLDGNGSQMPITVESLRGSMPAYTSVIQPGKAAFAGIEWRRSRSLPSDPEVLCPPAPAFIEARLPGESTFARMAWTPGDGLCDAKAGLRPIEQIL